MDSVPVRRALVSLTDKRGATEFTKALVEQGVEILSTGGTARHLEESGVAVTDVSAVTGFPEIMNGRVKTLHPAVHGGLLAVRDNPEHLQQAKDAQIPLIDMVVVNLYAFEEAISRPEVSPESAMDNVDIGGPALIRAAAKNHRFVAVVVDPEDYPVVIEEMKSQGKALCLATRRKLAAKAFALTAFYDTLIHSYLEELVQPTRSSDLPQRLALVSGRATPLRYGENPHQRAAFYPLAGEVDGAAARAERLNGKELSYNNILDLDAAARLVREFSEPAVCVIKHSNPCGAAVAGGIQEAYENALRGDPLSAFGGILALNRPLSRSLARLIADPARFFEAIIAPEVDPEAIALVRSRIKWGKNVRILACAGLQRPASAAAGSSVFQLRHVAGGMLLQDEDRGFEGETHERVTGVDLSREAEAALGFAWRIAKHVKSNAIVLACADRDGGGSHVVGVGAGQMSRIDATLLAGRKAGDASRGSVLASDAFFPFRDCVDAAAKLGVVAIIQPGGSVRDRESIAAADEQGITMVFTGRRHFRH